MSHRLLILASVLSSIPALLAGCGERTAERPAPVDVPVFIVSIDTLRSDRLPAYGYARGNTSAIDRFRNDAVLFSHAFSHAPTTLPSHASLFTGQLPPRHGVRDNVGYTLGGDRQTLASLLKSAGYTTGAAVSSYVLRRSTGIATGFDFFDDAFDYDRALLKTSAQRDGDKTRAALEQWLDGVQGRRVLGFLHLYEPHAPYTPPNEFSSAATPYDGEVSYADAIVGRFLESLKKRGLYDDALIIVLSDHGEGLGDHGEDEHGVFVYRESIQVPLLIKLPRMERANTTVESVVGLVDVVPTVLSAAGAAPNQAMDGVDLMSPAAGDRVIYSETYYPRLHFGWSELTSAIDARLHYIQAPAREIYEYRSDPAELTNVLSEKRREAFALAGKISAIPQNFAEPTAVDPEDQRKLAALGYIGSAGPVSGPRPDPKSRIRAVRELNRGFDLVARSEFRTAADHLAPFVKENPDIIDGWWLLGRSLARSGRSGEGLRVLKEAAQRFPGNSTVLLAAADVLFSEGRYQEARAHAELAVRNEPVGAREFLARMAMTRRDWEEAEKQLRAALQEAPGRTDTLMLLAEALRGQNKQQEVLSVLDRLSRERAQRSMPQPENLSFYRGEALLTDGRVGEAEQAFREETRLFPQNRKAWSSLALVVGAQGRREEARAVLLEGVRRNPDKKMSALAIESFEVMGDAEGARAVRAQAAR